MERDHVGVGTNGRGWEHVTRIIRAASKGCCLILSGKSPVILKPNRRLMAPKGPSSKRTFLKQWEPKIAGRKLMVSSQNGGVGGKHSLSSSHLNYVSLDLRKFRLPLGLMFRRVCVFLWMSGMWVFTPQVTPNSWSYWGPKSPAGFEYLLLDSHTFAVWVVEERD